MHLTCNADLKLSHGTTQGHFFKGDGALGQRESCFLWALASLVFPTGNLVCLWSAFAAPQLLPPLRRVQLPLPQDLISHTSCCPVFISQVLPASQDRPWAMNSTIKQGLLPLALRCLGSAAYWARALLLISWVTSQSDGGSVGYCCFPTPAHLYT